MARKFVVSLDLNKNELLNARIQNLSSAPSSPVAGQIYFDTTTNILYFYNGADWVSTSGSTSVIQNVIGSSVVGGTGLTSSFDTLTGHTTIDLDNTSVSAGSYGSATSIPTFTVDAQGRLTQAGSEDIATQLDLGADNAHGGYKLDLLTDSLKFVGGEGLDTDYEYNPVSELHTITISGEDASDTNKGIAKFDISDFSVTEGNVKLNADRVEDIAANLIIGGTGIDSTYDDGAGTLTIDIDSTVTTNDGQQTLTNKTLASGTSLGAVLNAAGKTIENLPTPVNPGDAANKSYVDGAISGLVWKQSVNLRADYNIPLSGNTYQPLTSPPGELVIDGHIIGNDSGSISGDGYRILLTAQTDPTENGIYDLAVTPDFSVSPFTVTYALTRSEDSDTVAELNGAAIFIIEGTQYGSTSWVQSNHYATSFADLDWVQFSGQGTYIGSDSISLNGNAINVIADESRGLSINPNGIGIAISNGLEFKPGSGALKLKTGTGLDASSGALEFAPGYGVRKYSENIGDGAATLYTVHHNFATRDLTIQVYENATPYSQVEVDIEHTDSNHVTIKFAQAPSLEQYRVVIVG